MRLAAIMAMTGLGALAACGAPSAGPGAGAKDRPTPQGFTPAAPAMAPGSALRFEGATYTAALAAGPAGRRATAGGAVAVAGRQLRIERQGQPLHYSEGRLAKDVAAQACAAEGGRYDPRAHGRFTPGQGWIFDGACA